MSANILEKLDKDHFRKNLIKYTKQAYQMLPEMDNPNILDIGCGSGIPTIELANLSNGYIIGLDIDQSSLDKLNKRIKKAQLLDRVKTVKGSMLELNFPAESFDIIWAEGVIAQIGFKTGLVEWGRFLKHNGFLVIHDDATNLIEKLKMISDCGYNLIGHFRLPKDAWWVDYYEPLEKRVSELRRKYRANNNFLRELDKTQKEIDSFRKFPEFTSVFFIMQKKK
ncbi:MAG: class I SAM-dependent methyltransferase [Promethearchaeota archaeon]